MEAGDRTIPDGGRSLAHCLAVPRASVGVIWVTLSRTIIIFLCSPSLSMVTSRHTSRTHMRIQTP